MIDREELRAWLLSEIDFEGAGTAFNRASVDAFLRCGSHFGVLTNEDKSRIHALLDGG